MEMLLRSQGAGMRSRCRHRGRSGKVAGPLGMWETFECQRSFTYVCQSSQPMGTEPGTVRRGHGAHGARMSRGSDLEQPAQPEECLFHEERSRAK